MHPTDQDYAYAQLSIDGEQSRVKLELRAAEWYRQQQQDGSTAEWRSIDDLQPHILEFEHLLRAGAYDDAMIVLGGIEDYLTWNGHAARVREMLARLDGQLQGERPRMFYFLAKGNNGVLFGDFDESRKAGEVALALACALGDLWHQGRIEHLLAGSAVNLESGVEHYSKALQLHRQAGNLEGERYCLFDIGLAYASLRNTSALLQYATEMRNFAEKSGVLKDAGLADNLFAIAHILNREWQAVLDTTQSLLEIYQDIWIPAVLNMRGIACLGLGRMEEAYHYLQSGFNKAMDWERPQYAARCAFNLAWVHYRTGNLDQAISVIERTRIFSKEIPEQMTVEILARVVEASQRKDVSGETRALLDCAQASRDSIDLWDSADIASRAWELADAASLDHLKAEARTFMEAFR